jgi:hypothetical protein
LLFLLCQAFYHFIIFFSFALQVQHAADWGGYGSTLLSRFNFIISGGLSCQTLHHLYPSICPWHLPDMQSILIDTCKEHGVTYNYLGDTVGDALRANVAFIQKLNESKPEAVAGMDQLTGAVKATSGKGTGKHGISGKGTPRQLPPIVFIDDADYVKRATAAAKKAQ